MGFRNLNLLLLVLLLIPLSVDRGLGVFVHGFQIRGQYLPFFVLLLVALWSRVRSEGLPAFVRNEVKEPLLQALLPLALCGAIGSALAIEPKRATLYWVWTMGTLFGVPFLFRYWKKIEFRRSAVLATLAYFLIQSLVVLVDTVGCMGTQGRWSGLGRNMIYEAQGSTLCRPTAWYQEPGYFCAFGLLVVVLALGVLRESNSLRRLRQFALWVAGLGSLAMVFSTSRMGWIGVAWVALWSAWKYRDVVSQSLARNKKWLYAIVAMVLAFGAFVGPVIYQHVGRGLIHPTQDGSFIARTNMQKAATAVFRSRPWFGAGPGMALHTYVNAVPGDPAGLSGYLSDPSRYNGPLAMSLYGELLSDWGVLGGLAFALFLGVWIIRVRNVERGLLLGTVLIVYLSTQTLARFDLWWVLALCL